MSSGLKGIIACASALVLIGGAFLALKLTEPKDGKVDDNSSSSAVVKPENESLTVYERGKADVKSIKIKNSNGEYTVTRLHKAVDDDDNTTFQVDEFKEFKMNDSELNNLAINAQSLYAVRVIDTEAADLSVYGLDKPVTEVTVTFDGDDPETYDIIVGDIVPGNENRYMSLKGTNKVYVIASNFMDNFGYEPEFYISRDVTEEKNDDIIVKKLTVDRKDLDYDIVLEYDPEAEKRTGGTLATSVMTSPVKAYINASEATKYTSDLFGLTASNLLSIDPVEEELELAGLKNPQCTVTAELSDGTKTVLKIGNNFSSSNTDATGYIAMVEGQRIMWQFAEGSLPWVKMKPEDAMSQMIFGDYIYDVSEISIEASGKTEKFECTGDSEETLDVKYNGKAYDAQRFKSFYQALIKAPAEEIDVTDDDTALGEKLAVVTVKNEFGEENCIEFYKSKTEERKAVIKKNGEISFKCRLAFAEKALLPNIENIEGDSSFVENW